jgi:hypothetical protein
MDFQLYHLNTFVWFPGQLQLTGVSSMPCNFLNLQHYLLRRVNTFNYESNQQDATRQVNLLFPVSSTCFRQCFCQSSGAHNSIYSIW